MISLLLLRIRQPIGEVHHIPLLGDSEVTSFLLENKKAVIIFTDGRLKYDFANFAIYKFSSKMRFAATALENGKKFGVKGPLAILAFNEAELVKTSQAPTKAIAFANWCNTIFAKDSIKIAHPEELRVIFSSTITCCIGIDKSERPQKLKEEITFYSVPREFFHYFNISVTSGYYIYRSADRQLVRMTSDPNKYILTKVTDLHSAYLEKKPFFGGYFMWAKNLTDCQREAQLLATLAAKFSEQMYLGPIAGSLAYTLSAKYGLGYFPVPFFAVFGDEGRWIISEDIHNETVISNFLTKIVNGELNHTIVSNEGSALSEDIKALSFNNVRQTIDADKTDTVLYVTAACGSKCRLWDSLIKQDAALLRNSTLTFYSLNASCNDLPSEFTETGEIPALFLWPAKKKVLGQMSYDGNAQIDEINRFLILESSGTFEKPEYNTSVVMKNAKYEAYPILRKIEMSHANNTSTSNNTQELNNTSAATSQQANNETQIKQEPGKEPIVSQEL